MTYYNPERVTMVGEDEPLAVITLDELQTFEDEIGLIRNGKFASALFRGVKDASRIRLDLHNRTGFHDRQPEPYHYEDEEIIAIRAAEAQRLHEDLEDGRIAIYDIGPKAVDRFGLFCEDLECESALTNVSEIN